METDPMLAQENEICDKRELAIDICWKGVCEEAERHDYESRLHYCFDNHMRCTYTALLCELVGKCHPTKPRDQEAFSKLFGKDRATISRYMNAVSAPQWKELSRIFATLYPQCIEAPPLPPVEDMIRSAARRTVTYIRSDIVKEPRPAAPLQQCDYLFLCDLALHPDWFKWSAGFDDRSLTLRQLDAIAQQLQMLPPNASCLHEGGVATAGYLLNICEAWLPSFFIGIDIIISATPMERIALTALGGTQP